MNTTNDSDNGAVAKTNEKQLAANRANAKKSTGPKSAAGKLTVAGNGVAHGIYAFCPVVAGLESPQEWNGYRTEMMISFAPVGMLETTLAERIILQSWRLRRVARYESEHLRSEQQAAQEQVGQAWLSAQRQYDRDGADKVVEEVKGRSKWWERVWPTLEFLAEGSEETALDKQSVVNLLYLFQEKLRAPNPAGEGGQQLPDLERWTVGLVRQRIRLLVEKHGKSRDSLDSLLKKIKEDGLQAFRAAEKVNRRLNEYRREHLLPDDSAIEKVMRYETHLSRLLHRDLHELQRLQAMRQGQLVTAPATIDVDVTSSSKTGTENCV